jgi:hypothetical protein
MPKGRCEQCREITADAPDAARRTSRHSERAAAFDLDRYESGLAANGQFAPFVFPQANSGQRRTTMGHSCCEFMDAPQVVGAAGNHFFLLRPYAQEMRTWPLLLLPPLAACQASQETLTRDGGQCELETMRRYPNDRDQNDNTVPNSAGPSMTFMQACMAAKGHRLNIGKNSATGQPIQTTSSRDIATNELMLASRITDVRFGWKADMHSGA